MANLDQTLQIFQDLLEAEPPIDIGDADEAIWAYLSTVQGLRAQAEALETLRARTIELSSDSASMPRLLDDLDRHSERLRKRPV